MAGEKYTCRHLLAACAAVGIQGFMEVLRALVECKILNAVPTTLQLDSLRQLCFKCNTLV
jgi:hypothetical protein